MTDETSTAEDTSRRLAIAEMQVERSKVVMESLAGFCHALGQPATVLLSSIELLKMPGVDEDTKRQVIDMCHEAVLEIKSLLAEMKTSIAAGMARQGAAKGKLGQEVRLTRGGGDKGSRTPDLLNAILHQCKNSQGRPETNPHFCGLSCVARILPSQTLPACVLVLS